MDEVKKKKKTFLWGQMACVPYFLLFKKTDNAFIKSVRILTLPYLPFSAESNVSVFVIFHCVFGFAVAFVAFFNFASVSCDLPFCVLLLCLYACFLFRFI